jgi:hypothetical protein
MAEENGVQATPDAPGGQPQNTKLTPEVEDSELRRARKEAAAARVAKNELATQLEQALSGIDRLTKMFEESEKRRNDAEQAALTATKQAQREQLLQSVVAKFQLPAELAKRLHGETAEELEADAAELAQLVKPQTPPAPTNQGRTIAMGNVPANNGDAAGTIGRRLADRAMNGKAEQVRFSEPYNPDDNA